MDSNMHSFECRNCKHDLQTVSVQHYGATQAINQDASRIKHDTAALHTSMPPPEQPLQQNASEDFLHDVQFPWDHDLSMELDSLRATITTPKNGATEDYSLDFPVWSEPASSSSKSDMSAVFSRLDHLELIMTQTRVNIVSVELGMKALSHDLLEGKRAWERSASELEKLMNGLDKFMCHVAQRLDEDDQAMERDGSIELP